MSLIRFPQPISVLFFIKGDAVLSLLGVGNCGRKGPLFLFKQPSLTSDQCLALILGQTLKDQTPVPSLGAIPIRQSHVTSLTNIAILTLVAVISSVNKLVFLSAAKPSLKPCC